MWHRKEARPCPGPKSSAAILRQVGHLRKLEILLALSSVSVILKAVRILGGGFLDFATPE